MSECSDWRARGRHAGHRGTHTDLVGRLRQRGSHAVHGFVRDPPHGRRPYVNESISLHVATSCRCAGIQKNLVWIQHPIGSDLSDFLQSHSHACEDPIYLRFLSELIMQQVGAFSAGRYTIDLQMLRVVTSWCSSSPARLSPAQLSPWRSAPLEHMASRQSTRVSRRTVLRTTRTCGRLLPRTTSSTRL